MTRSRGPRAAHVHHVTWLMSHVTAGNDKTGKMKKKNEKNTPKQEQTHIEAISWSVITEKSMIYAPLSRTFVSRSVVLIVKTSCLVLNYYSIISIIRYVYKDKALIHSNIDKAFCTPVQG